MRSHGRVSRRDVLRGRVVQVPPELHVSSLVVHVRPEKADAAAAKLRAIPGVEIHGGASGKIIVTLETPIEADIVTRLNEISLLDGVLSAALVYHHFEPAAELERDESWMSRVEHS
jgi:nitrate reductase NapD